ncbi:MAG: hypothetical protein AB1486_01345 [Planctomycetota bacterium]
MKLLLARKLLLSVSVLVVLPLLIELVARLFFPEPRVKPSAVPPELGRFDPFLGWALEPGAREVSYATGNPVEYRINSKGLRDDETSYEKPAGVFRIVIAGDSTVFGYGVPIEQHFTKLIEGYLKGVEVINMGISGFGVDQELLFLRTEGFRYQPDLVIAVVEHYGMQRHLNTVRFGKWKPRFVLDGGKLVLTNSPVPETPPPETRTTRGVLLGWDRWLIQQSKAYRLLREWALTRAATARRPAAEKPAPEVLPQFGWSRDELHELAEAIVSAMHEEALQHGSKFLLVTRMERLHRVMTSRGVLSLNLSAALNNPRFIIPGLNHYNESGYGVLAWEIVRFLHAQNLLPGAPPGK